MAKTNTTRKKPVKKVAATKAAAPRKSSRVKAGSKAAGAPTVKPTSEQPAKLTGAFRLFWRACLELKRQWKLIGGILLVYGLLNIVFVRGLGSGLDLSGIKDSLQGGTASGVTSTLSAYGALLGSSGNTGSDAAGVYQSVLVILASLALIWALRESWGKTVKLRIRDAYYQGTGQLVPFVLVLAVIAIQFIPMLVGAGIYGIVTDNNLATNGFEQGAWAVLVILLSLVTFYLLTSSLFAMYIVTLPEMTPMKALRSARKLVRPRRWTLLRKVLFLPLALLVLSAVLIVPIILFATPIADWLFFVISLLGLAIIHSYMYSLYRELL